MADTRLVTDSVCAADRTMTVRNSPVPLSAAPTVLPPAVERAPPRLPSVTFAGFAAALAILFMLAVTIYRNIEDTMSHQMWVAHTHEVLGRCEEAIATLRDARAEAQSFVISGESAHLARYQASHREVLSALEELRQLTRDNERQQTRIQELTPLLAEEFRVLDAIVEAGLASGVANVPPLLRELHGVTEEVRRVVHDFKGNERALLEQRVQQFQDSERATLRSIVGGNIAAFAILICAIVLLRNEMQRRALAQRQAQRYAADIAVLNRDLQQRRVELEAANKDLEGFTYSVSHDLRTPLRAIAGYSQILQEDYAQQLDAEGVRLLDVVRESTFRMSALINDLLEFSRLGRASITAIECDMKPVVVALFEELVSTRVAEPPRLVLLDLPKAYGDPALLRQVWANLLANAVKFSSRREEAIVEVSGRREQGMTTYCIRDNGVGFDMAYYDKLFGVFQRLHGHAEFPGTGVGLAIVQRVVSRHGGRVWAEGAPDAGATFYFNLPRPEDANE